MSETTTTTAGTGTTAGGGAAANGAGAAATTTAATTAGAAGAGATTPAAWYASADLKLSDGAALFAKGHNFPDVSAALEYGAKAEEMARSRNVIEKPDPKNLAAWKGWGELGWVEKVDDYKIEPPKDLKGFVPDPGLLDGFRALAHANRMPASMAQAVYGGMAKMMGERIAKAQGDAATARANASKETMTALQGKWSGKFDTNMELAKRAARATGLDADTSAELEKALAGPDGKGGSAKLLEFFQKIGARMSEAQLVGEGADGARTMTAREAELERKALESNAEWMKIFRDERHPLHAEHVAQRQKLIKIEASRKAA